MPISSPYEHYFSAYQQPAFEFILETDKFEYRRDEPVHITFIVKNTKELPVPVQYGSSKKFEISIVNNEGCQIWLSSYGMRYAAMVIYLEFKAKESSNFSVTWDQENNDGTLAPPGKYTIKADWTSYYGGSASTEIILTAPSIMDSSYSNCKETTDDLSPHDSINGQIFRYEYADNILNLYHNDVVYNCCIEDIVLTMNSINDVIEVYEDAILQGTGCNCICNYDLAIDIANLSFGSYEVRFSDKNTGELYGVLSDVMIPCFKEKEHRVINVEKFKKIRQFIFDQGQRETYCQMYNNNPYYPFSDDFVFYLNPRGQLVDMHNAPVEEFIEIAIQVMPSIQTMPTRIKYYYIRYDEAAQNICMRVRSIEEEIKEVEKEIDFFFTEALKMIDN